MADNPYVNKVEYGSNTLIDLTADTVTPQTLLEGATAHDKSGAPISGAVAVAPASSTSPAMDGTASVGVENAYARGDHVHPTDTSRAAANNVVTLDGEQTITGDKFFSGTLSADTLEVDTIATMYGDINSPNDTLDITSARNIALSPTGYGSTPGVVDCTGHRVVGVSSPTTNTDAANKDYVDTADAALQTQIDALGEPFRVKNWASSFTVEIPTCTEDISNTSIAKMTFSITGEEGDQYQVVGMIAYEVFDAASGGNRINCWPVCQFTGNGQKELSVRWMCGGTTRKTAKRINAWVLLKHR